MTISNNEIKRIKSLQQKKFRDESGLFIVEGEKMVEEALKSGFAVEAVYRKDEIGENAMARISSLASPSPVLAVVKKPSDHIIDDVTVLSPLLSQGGLYLALDTIRDPGNLGTILRVADWFGIDAELLIDHAWGYEPTTIESIRGYKPQKNSLGAVFRTKMHYLDLPDLSELVLRKGGKVYGTFLDGMNMYERELDNGSGSPVVIVIGNEANGISPQMEALVSDRLYIPPYPADSPGSESLNAAIAAAITIAEFRRRK